MTKYDYVIILAIWGLRQQGNMHHQHKKDTSGGQESISTFISDEIRRELLVEALKDTAYTADLMAATIDQHIIDLAVTDKNVPTSAYYDLFDGIGSCLCYEITEDERV